MKQENEQDKNGKNKEFCYIYLGNSSGIVENNNKQFIFIGLKLIQYNKIIQTASYNG